MEQHKTLINKLFCFINEKKNQNYILTSEKEILEKELNFWLYNFSSIKLFPEFREKLKKLDIERIKSNIDMELSYKKLINFYILFC